MGNKKLYVELQGVDGDATTPAYSFTADTNTGMYRIGASSIGFTLGGTLRLTLATTALTSTVDIVVPDEVYGAGWNGSLEVPTKNAVYDKIETISAGSASVDWKDSVRVATTAAGTLATSFENGDTIDGVVLATGNRILIKNQSTGSENGIYTVNASGAPTRATDADASAEVTSGMKVAVAEGTVNANTVWTLTTADTITLGTTALTFSNNQIVADGSVSTPGYAFTGARTTGFYHAGSNSLGIVTAGAHVANFTSAGMLEMSNSGGTAGIRFAGDSTGHIYHWGTGVIGVSGGILASGGLTALSLNVNNNSSDATIQMTHNGSNVSTLSVDTSALSIKHLTPSFGIKLYSRSAGGVDQLVAHARSSNQLEIVQGTNSLPALTFTSDTTTGIYRSAASAIGHTLGGTQHLNLTTSVLDMVVAKRITNVTDPSSAQDAATKNYVDTNAITFGSHDYKNSVRVATTAAGTLATSFENGDTIDGVVLATGNRILIKDQAAGAENGIYTVNASGAPTRATDADASSEVTTGMTVFVSEGTVNANTVWKLTTADPITLGTTALVFSGIIKASAGSQTAPSHTFSTDATTGIYDAGGGALGVTAAGATVGAFSSNTLSLVGTTVVQNLLGSTSNMMVWTTTGAGAPTVTTRSAGTKIVLYPSLSGSLVDYAMGISTNVFWSSVGNSSGSFWWYAGTTIIANLNGAGDFYLVGQSLGKFGTNSSPTYSFSGDGTTGMYRVGASSIGFTLGGTNTLTLATTSLTSTQPILSPNGSLSNVAHGFSGDPNTGLYTDGTADTFSLVTNATARVTINTATVTSTLPILAPNGSASAPSISFSGDTNTGFARDAIDDTLFIVTGGTSRISLTASDITVTLPIRTANGSNTAPSHSFSGDPNTGMYQTGTADTLALVTGGNNVLTLTAAREARINDQFDIEVMNWMNGL